MSNIFNPLLISLCFVTMDRLILTLNLICHNHVSSFRLFDFHDCQNLSNSHLDYPVFVKKMDLKRYVIVFEP